LTAIGLKKRTAAFSLLPLVFLGFTTIIAELLLLLWFQTLYGSVYGRLALLLASFMAGLFLGAVSGSRTPRARFGRLVLIQAGILSWLAGLFLLLRTPLPEPLFYLLLASLGFLAGDLFVTANRLFLEKRRDYGLGYGLDLFGSFLGALAASSVLIPLAGLRGLTVMLLALNGLVWLFVAFATRKAV
jgi:spermidine synthase